MTNIRSHVLHISLTCALTNGDNRGYSDRLLSAGLSNERHVSHMLYLRDSSHPASPFFSLTHLCSILTHTHRPLRSFYLLRRWVVQKWDWVKTPKCKWPTHHCELTDKRENTFLIDRETKAGQDWESTEKQRRRDARCLWDCKYLYYVCVCVCLWEWGEWIEEREQATTEWAGDHVILTHDQQTYHHHPPHAVFSFFQTKMTLRYNINYWNWLVNFQP